MNNSNPKLIIALDFDSEKAALSLVEQLDPQQCRLKVGKEMFTRLGPQFVRRLQDQGYEIFLDLKFHDIPNTVAAACQAAADLGVWMVNLHALGGEKMMMAAHEALQPFGDDRPLLIAVTILTSHSDEDIAKLGLSGSVVDNVLRLASLTEQCGLDGVVCSAQEAISLRQQCQTDFKLVTPGIRLQASDDDQKRVMTPQEALAAGVNYLVVGRPITRAEDPMAALAAFSTSV